MKYKTIDEGWDTDDIPPLGDFIQAHDNMARDVYEIKNCKRTQTLVELRDALLEDAHLMVEALESIGDNDEVVEVCVDCEKPIDECTCNEEE